MVCGPAARPKEQHDMATEQPTVAIIIPVRNRAAEMQRLLESVARQEYPLAKITVVVVDALSTDGTQEVCGKFPFVKLIELPVERHVGRNKGVVADRAGRDRVAGAAVEGVDEGIGPGGAAEQAVAGLALGIGDHHASCRARAVE